MKTTRIIFCIIFLLTTLLSKAQFVSAIIGIDGLTCSACSFSTEKSIRKLDFVDSVFMELDKNIATVYFKKDKPISIQLLTQKVVDAGFAVRSIDVLFSFDNLTVSNNYCFVYENSIYQFIKLEKGKTLNGIVTLKFVGEKYMAKKEFKNWKLYCVNSCIQLDTPNIKNHYYVYIP